jgi:two-component system heavy metal sensor histidine kinase CusS
MSLRLVVLFGLLALVLFTAVGSYLSHSLHMQLEARDDEELAGKCRSINHLVEHAASLEDILTRRHLVLDTLSGHDQLLVRIARADGSTLMESHDPTRTAPGVDLSTIKIRSWDHIEALRMGDLRARYIASMPVTRSGEKAIVLVVRTASDRMLLLADYRADVWWAASIGTALATLLSYFLVRSGLRPLRMMAAQTRAISANKLDTRLDLQAAPRELHEIVQSFNDMLDRLHCSFQQLSQFSADLAHDVRTPLNNLMVQTQVALGKPRSLDEYQALLSSNIEEYERLSRMMESMLFLARADNAHVVLQIQPLDVAEELNRIAEYFEGIAEEAQVRIAGRQRRAACRCHPAAPCGGQPGRQRHPLYATAGQHQPGGNRGGATLIGVANPGPGIPPDQIERIFDRFYRADLAQQRQRFQWSGPGHRAHHHGFASGRCQRIQ